jgi:hypothetical protein
VVKDEPRAAPARHRRRYHSTELMEVTGERTVSV